MSGVLSVLSVSIVGCYIYSLFRNQVKENNIINEYDYFLDVGSEQQIEDITNFDGLSVNIENNDIIEISNDAVIKGINVGQTVIEIKDDKTNNITKINVTVTKATCDWKNIYLNYFSEVTINDLYQDEFINDSLASITYQLIDLNNDEIPEFIIYDENYQDYQIGIGHVFSINENMEVYKVVELSLSYATYGYDEENNIYIINDTIRLSDQSIYDIYNGIDKVRSFSRSVLDENAIYYIDDTQVEEKIFYNELENYDLDNPFVDLQNNGKCIYYKECSRNEFIKMTEELINIYEEY